MVVSLGSLESQWVSEPRTLQRVLRGGSWLYPSWLLRATYRSGHHPGFRGVDFEFRVVLEVK